MARREAALDPLSNCSAAVLVAATEDAYVDRESAEAIHRAWKGSELRWVEGGHVSSFVLHQPVFRRAILDSISRLS